QTSKIVLDVFFESARFKPDVLYVTLSTSGVGLYKDLLVVLAGKYFSKELFVHFRNFGLKKACHSSSITNFIANWILKGSKAIVLEKSLVFDVDHIYDFDSISIVGNCVSVPEVIDRSPQNALEKLSVVDNLS